MSRTRDAIQVGWKRSGKFRLENWRNRYCHGASVTNRPRSAAGVRRRVRRLAPPRRPGRSMPRQPLYSAAGRVRGRTGLPAGHTRLPGPAPSPLESDGGVPGVRALVSVANRDGISSFARDLLSLGVEVFATDGTREHLAADGVEVAPVSDLTHVPALVGGQVKTFHPAVYAGILARRDIPAQLDELVEQGIGLIDLVVVNVKPFAPEVGRSLMGIDEAIEMIDVGGAALLGAAARNAAGVSAVASPEHYDAVVDEIKELGHVSPELRQKLAAEAFGAVAAYHAEIAAYLNQISGNVFPKRLALVLEKVDDLRYGENPHQRAAFYRETTHRSGTLADATQIQGSRPSFNNLLDLDTAYRIARDFTAPTVAIVKHTDPVGLASNDNLAEAYRKALECDSVAAFGGIVAINRQMDLATAREIAANSYEAVVAPSYSEAALAVLRM